MDDIPVPPALKSIRPYIKVGKEFLRRDPLVSYYCYVYAIQAGLETNYKEHKDAKGYLVHLMNYVESAKTALKANSEYNEVLSSEDDIAGNAWVENVAKKLFDWADGEDRKSNFNKHVVKSFYTSSILFDVLGVFKEPLSEEGQTKQKYARWKATYIHNCLKNNEQPVPGPVGGLEDTSESQEPAHDTSGDYIEQPSHSQSKDDYSGYSPQPTAAPRKAVSPQEDPEEEYTPGSSTGLSANDLREAEKLCKFAASALNYEDIPTAISQLEQCLKLLKQSG